MRQKFNCLNLLFASSAAHAELSYNLPVGVTPLSHDIYTLHMLILWVCVGIGILVFGVMLYSIVKHRKSSGHRAVQFHEHMGLEILWTVIPFLILVLLAIPATHVLVSMNNTEKEDITIKITGYQWKWRYEYLNQDIHFFSNFSTPLNQLQGKEPKDPLYLRTVDHPLVVPIHKKIRFLMTSNDVIHSWWVPDFGVKRDALPGYINEAWARINRPGTYYGQCTELCGINHAYMPIVVIAMTEADFDKWVAAQKAPPAPVPVATPAPIAAPVTAPAPVAAAPTAKNKKQKKGKKVATTPAAKPAAPTPAATPTTPAAPAPAAAPTTPAAPAAAPTTPAAPAVAPTTPAAPAPAAAPTTPAAPAPAAAPTTPAAPAPTAAPTTPAAAAPAAALTTPAAPAPAGAPATPVAAPLTPAPAGAPATAAAAAPAAGQVSKEQLMQKGQQIFESSCAMCHQTTGLGMPPMYPALKGSAIATGPAAAHLNRVLNGKPGTAMQAFKEQFDDADLAAVITYERNSWGNQASVVQPSDVTAARAKPPTGE
jgi:cytochrome c oxidase subunit 2